MYVDKVILTFDIVITGLTEAITASVDISRVRALLFALVSKPANKKKYFLENLKLIESLKI